MDVTAMAATALTIGALGGVHCAAMCGGIAGALSLTLPPERRTPRTLWTHQICYGLGRVSSYAVAGVFFGSLGFVLADALGPAGAFGLRAVAAVLLVMIGLQLGGWWAGISALERLGARLWRWLAPTLGSDWQGTSLLRAVGVGAAWGWLPCGLVYSTLAWAAAAADPLDAGIAMLCFGLGTLPAVMLSGVAAARFSAFVRRDLSRKTAAAFVIALAIWTVFAARPLLARDAATCEHGSHPAASH
jgi:sulfite exporter TauE/SafE